MLFLIRGAGLACLHAHRLTNTPSSVKKGCAEMSLKYRVSGVPQGWRWDFAACPDDETCAHVHQAHTRSLPKTTPKWRSTRKTTGESPLHFYLNTGTLEERFPSVKGRAPPLEPPKSLWRAPLGERVGVFSLQVLGKTSASEAIEGWRRSESEERKGATPGASNWSG